MNSFQKSMVRFGCGEVLIRVLDQTCLTERNGLNGSGEGFVNNYAKFE